MYRNMSPVSPDPSQYQYPQYSFVDPTQPTVPATDVGRVVHIAPQWLPVRSATVSAHGHPWHVADHCLRQCARPFPDLRLETTPALSNNNNIEAIVPLFDDVPSRGIHNAGSICAQTAIPIACTLDHSARLRGLRRDHLSTPPPASLETCRRTRRAKSARRTSCVLMRARCS